MKVDYFDNIDRSVKNILVPMIQEGIFLMGKVRFICDTLGTGGFLRKKTTYKDGPLKLVKRIGFATREYRVFYNNKLVLHTDNWKKVHVFKEGPWIKELVPIYLKAKVAHLTDHFDIDYLDELCDNYDHDTGACSVHAKGPCPCLDFKHEEDSPT